MSRQGGADKAAGTGSSWLRGIHNQEVESSECVLLLTAFPYAPCTVQDRSREWCRHDSPPP